MQLEDEDALQTRASNEKCFALFVITSKSNWG